MYAFSITSSPLADLRIILSGLKAVKNPTPLTVETGTSRVFLPSADILEESTIITGAFEKGSRSLLPVSKKASKSVEVPLFSIVKKYISFFESVRLYRRIITDDATYATAEQTIIVLEEISKLK